MRCAEKRRVLKYILSQEKIDIVGIPPDLSSVLLKQKQRRGRSRIDRAMPRKLLSKNWDKVTRQDYRMEISKSAIEEKAEALWRRSSVVMIKERLLLLPIPKRRQSNREN